MLQTRLGGSAQPDCQDCGLSFPAEAGVGAGGAAGKEAIRGTCWKAPQPRTVAGAQEETGSELVQASGPKTGDRRESRRKRCQEQPGGRGQASSLGPRSCPELGEQLTPLRPQKAERMGEGARRQPGLPFPALTCRVALDPLTQLCSLPRAPDSPGAGGWGKGGGGQAEND